MLSLKLQHILFYYICLHHKKIQKKVFIIKLSLSEVISSGFDGRKNIAKKNKHKSQNVRKRKDWEMQWMRTLNV